MTVFIISLLLWILSWAFPTDTWSILGIPASAHPFLWKAWRELSSVSITNLPLCVCGCFVLFFNLITIGNSMGNLFLLDIYNLYLRIISKEETSCCIRKYWLLLINFWITFKCSFYFLTAGNLFLQIYPLKNWHCYIINSYLYIFETAFTESFSITWTFSIQ